jgi:hypothetical protein
MPPRWENHLPETPVLACKACAKRASKICAGHYCAPLLVGPTLPHPAARVQRWRLELGDSRRRTFERRAKMPFVLPIRSGRSVSAGGGSTSSAPPTLAIYRVATIKAHHRRAARSGALMWVYCHCPPQGLKHFKPCGAFYRNLAPARSPYELAAEACRAAVEDAGLATAEGDGMSIWPQGKRSPWQHGSQVWQHPTRW